MQNRLAQSLSPYLQQHKDNPVDWYPWGPEALTRARVEKKPIFLSIGYSSCHWCHVMERESFSHPQIAEILNAHFISIKVDREERPDLDHIYMTALQMMTGQGGWPLNIFLTPDLRPFFGGTYFAPDGRYGRPPFRDLLLKIADIFKNQQDIVRKNADQLVGLLAQQGQFFEPKEKIDETILNRVIENLQRSYDPKGGGLGGAPKFFHVDGLRFLLRASFDQKNADFQKMVTNSLEKMSIGGVYDHVGGGFHRYSTDANWQVPHFEKMLYDNALLSVLYLETYLITKDSTFLRVLEGTLDWVTREMTSPEGGFFSAIDADSEHEEGKFYVWTEDEVRETIPAEIADDFVKTYNISSQGNFEGKNIPHLAKPLTEDESARLKTGLKKLLERRAKRIWPLVDRKILTSWNGLMISAFAKAGFWLENEKYIEIAKRTADFLWKTAYVDSKLRHVVLNSKSGDESYLEDYAFLAESYLDLFEATSDFIYFDRARILAQKIMSDFFDQEHSGFWATLSSREDVLVRYKEIFDGALPAPFHSVLSVLHRLFELTGDSEWMQTAEKSVRSILGTALEAPGGFHRFALIVDEMVKGAKMIVATSPSREVQKKLRAEFAPRVHLFIWSQRSNLEDILFFQGKWSAESKVLTCEAGQCS